MLIPDTPRYSIVNNKALSFLLQFKIKSLPITIKDIVSKLNCSIKTYKFHAKKIGCSVAELCGACGSLDGYSIYDERTNKYKIIYNNEIKSRERIRFTLMHEIGHIYLNHFTDFEQTKLCRGGISDEDHEILDKEANHFASKVLAPEIVLLHAGWNKPQIIHQNCALSIEAAKYKAEKIVELGKRKDFITSLESKVVQQFRTFIYQKFCTNCRHYFVIPNAKFCPVCGRKTILWGTNKKMVYETIELDRNGKAIICPRCENEEIIKDGDFCHICGAILVNKCLGSTLETYDGEEYFKEDGCGEIVPGNARFCPYCGKETTFYHSELLKKWDENNI